MHIHTYTYILPKNGTTVFDMSTSAYCVVRVPVLLLSTVLNVCMRLLYVLFVFVCSELHLYDLVHKMCMRSFTDSFRPGKSDTHLDLYKKIT